MSQLVSESLALVVKKEATAASERFGCQKLDLCVGVLGIDETSWVNLDLLHIDAVRTDSECHLVAVTGAVVAVGGREVVVLGPVLLEKTVLREIGSVATSGKNNRALDGMLLAVLLVLYTDDYAVLVEQASDARFENDLDVLGDTLGKVLQTLELSVSDDHAGKLGVSSVCARVGMAAEPGNLGQVKCKLVLEPIDGIARSSSEDLDEGITGEVAGLIG
jgi:hypothetical protein